MRGGKRYWDWTIEDLQLAEDAIQAFQHQLSVVAVHSVNETVRDRASSVELVLRAAVMMLRAGPEDPPNSAGYIANNLRQAIGDYNLDVVTTHPGHNRDGRCCGVEPVKTGTLIVHCPQEAAGAMCGLESEPSGVRYQATIRQHPENAPGDYTAVFKHILAGTYAVFDDWAYFAGRGTPHIEVQVKPGRTVHVGQREA